MNKTQPVSWPMTLAALAVAVEFCVSANLLTWVGIPYVVEGGVWPEKIHPGTYLLCLAFAVRVFNQDRPNRPVWLLIGGDSKLALYLCSLALCMVYLLLTTGAGNVIVLFDTFLPAGLLACVVSEASPRELQIMRNVLRCGICTNAAIALGETAAHATLIPLYLNDLEYHPIDGEFRPTALYDHPLTGGVMTLLGLTQAPHRYSWRGIYLFLCLTALISFGGRAAIAAVAMSAMALSGVAFANRALRRDAAALRLLFCYGVCVASCLAIAMIWLAAGFGERLSGHLYWDQSAQVRLAQWSLLGDLNGWQILLGTRREDLLALLAPLWLRSGVGVIENFWLLMFVSLGVLGFPIFLLAFSTLLSWCWERTRLRGRLMLASFVMAVSASNSLARKSTLLVGLIAAIACLPEWQARRSGAARMFARPVTDSILATAGK